ncbi:lysine N(6)-hydroxylase/L-ornithine N(5)-oxygenase family protein [Pseudomonas silvicola]|nr:lysine N(6)-hydroxylase/L-ornithine N(5)-oxygenase family protein [Pseudomonas silvicola]
MTAAQPQMTAHDVIGVGFGPSNLALAIAIEEMRVNRQRPLDCLFIDKQQTYRWHGDTLASQSELQISFLKDLVSLRNPTSHFSFVNYLKEQGRLIDFINLRTFYPCRTEFNDYLRWVAEQFADQAVYGEQVLRLEPVAQKGPIDLLRVISRDAAGVEHARQARSVVVSTGGTPRIPELFKAFRHDPRIFHHSSYLSSVAKLPCSQGKPMRIAIIGSGQSAAEAFIDLHDSFPTVEADMIVRGSALKPADDSPFVNEVFAPRYTELMFQQSAEQRKHLIEEFHNTNYSVIDPGLIERIYALLYRQKISASNRHAVLCLRHVQGLEVTPQGIDLSTQDIATGQVHTKRYDAVILATGYSRDAHRELLAPLEGYLNDFQVNRQYRALSTPDLRASVFLQGFCEASHGLSDTLLSVLACRSEEIADALYQSLLAPAIHPGLKIAAVGA